MPTRGSAVALCLVLTGCTSAPGTVAPTGSPSTADAATADVLRCDAYVGTSAPPADRRRVLGVVALPTGPSSSALNVHPSGLRDRSHRLFAKDGLLVRAGTSFEIVVPSRVGIGWADAPSPRQRVVVSSCADASGSDWLAYAGGYWVDRPSCVPLVVKAGGRRERVHIGVGVPCPGQARPPA